MTWVCFEGLADHNLIRLSCFSLVLSVCERSLWLKGSGISSDYSAKSFKFMSYILKASQIL